MTFDAASTYDARAWDEFVSSQAAGHFMQSYAWGDFQRQLGWEVHYCVLRDEAGIRGSQSALEALTRQLTIEVERAWVHGAGARIVAEHGANRAQILVEGRGRRAVRAA